MSIEQTLFAHCSKLMAHLLLKLQSCFPGRIGQCLNAPVINVSAAVEYDLGYTLRLRTLGNGLPNRFGGSDIAASAPILFLAFGGAGGHQRLPVQVVDHLHIDVIQRAVHIQTRALRRSLHFLADALVYVSALLVLCNFRKHD
jgi:hypothetical protein